MSKRKDLTLIGDALKKAKKIKNAKNFKNNSGIAAPEESVAFTTTPTENEIVIPTALSNEELFFGFSPQNEVDNHTMSCSEPLFGLSPLSPVLKKLKTIELGSHPISVENVSTTLLSSTCKPVDFKKPVIEQEAEAQVNLPLKPIAKKNSFVVRAKTFFKIVLGDFCQFSTKFPSPHHQCTAMAATALAYNTLKPIVEWNANDLNDILYSGQIYYTECMTNLLLTDPNNKSTFLEAISLNENLSIASQNIEVFVNLEECRGGPYESRDIITEAFFNFEKKDFTNGIIIYNDYAYAILRYRNSYNSTYYYIFFDSHGRKEDGTKVQPVTDDEGKSSILFFENANSFIDFFLQERQLLQPGQYSNSRNLILVPLHFVNVSNDVNFATVPSLMVGNLAKN